MTWALFLLLGLIFGSFFNVCIWRIPRGESLLSPPSHCPVCGRPIRFYDNIPVLSYLILKGKCRDCGKPIAIRYPIIEGLTGLLFVFTYARFGLDWLLLRALVFISLLIVISGIDFDHKIIPFRLSISGIIIGLGVALLPIHPRPLTALRSSFFGGLLGAVFILFAWALWRFILARPFHRLGVKQREGMGWGDLPFTAMIGVFLGPKGISVALAGAVVTGVIFGVITRVLRKTKPGQEIPFGPFLALGGLIGLFWGEDIFSWYISTVLSPTP